VKSACVGVLSIIVLILVIKRTFAQNCEYQRRKINGERKKEIYEEY